MTHWARHVDKANGRTRIRCSCGRHTTMWTTRADAIAIHAKHAEMQRALGET